MKKIVITTVSSLFITTLLLSANQEVDSVDENIESTTQLKGLYLGTALSTVSVRDSNVDLNFFSEEIAQDRLGNLTLVAGYEFNEYFSTELRYTTRIVDDNIVDMSGISLLAKPQYTIYDQTKIYALLGFGSNSIDGTRSDIVEVDESSFQWGLGISYDINNNISIYADYLNLGTELEGVFYNNANEISVDALTIGVNYNF